MPAPTAPCDGCGAVPGEPCRWDCLSTVTDSEGQPLTLFAAPDPYGTPDMFAEVES